jgi:predicted nucleic acid-binding protein
VRAGHLAESEAIETPRAAISLVTHPVDDADLAVEALTTAARFDHPVYDAMYAALARRLGGVVATRDRRLKDLLAKLRIDAVP